MLSVDGGSRHGLAGSSAQGVSQAAFSFGSVTKEESTCKLRLRALAEFISFTEGLGFLLSVEAIPCFYFCFLKDFIYFFLQRWEGRQKERERNIDVHEKHQSVASRMLPTRDLAQNPGMCPDQEPN